MSETLSDLKLELRNDYLQKMYNSQYDGRYHDVSLIYTNHTERIPSVKYLLILQSDYFITAIARGNPNDPLHLPYDENIPLDIFKVLHNSIFVLGNINVDGWKFSDKFKLFCLSNYYLFEGVEEAMNKYFIDSLKRDNCWKLLYLSAKYAQNGLGDACGFFISRRITNLASNNELLKLDVHSLAFLLQRDTFCLQEDIIYDIALAWERRNPDVDKTLIRNSIRIQLAMKGDVRQQMINWCGREPNENDSRPRIQNPNINIPNLDYFT